MSRVLLFFALLFVVCLSSVDAGACKPVKLLMTRASGTNATYEDGVWSTKYGLSTVNLANLNGALKYVITETIDVKTGVTKEEGECYRKNYVQYIHFYAFTICNSDESLWWFNQRPAGYAGDDAAYNFGEYGQYLTMDEGQCHDSPFCAYLNGGKNRPKLGPFVGWQDVSDDVRNPTDDSYWYSVPGECPLKKWSGDDKKTDQCIKDNPSGKCEDGVTPDGKKCTWSYEMLGQINIDELVGITTMKNGKYKNYEEFCLDGGIEFERDEKNDYVNGLDFWKNPLNKSANAERIVKLVDFYGKQENNKPLPKYEELKASNPRCYTSVPGCYDKDSNKETCTRDESQRCVPCEEVEGGCSSDGIQASEAFPSLPEVEFSGQVTDSTDANDGKDSSTSNIIRFNALLIGLIVGIFIFNF